MAPLTVTRTLVERGVDGTNQDHVHGDSHAHGNHTTHASGYHNPCHEQADSCDDENLSHNAAAALFDGSLLLAGGRYSHGAHPFRKDGWPMQHRGVLLYEAHDVSTIQQTKGAPLILGNHSGCIEARQEFAPLCEFDGRLSLARRQTSSDGGKDVWYLYARANMVAGGRAGVAGGRHVQVTRATSPHGPWQRFEVANFINYELAAERNIYFASVNTNPVEPRTMLGLFPYYNTNTKDAYIGLALTCDGARFSRMHPLIGAKVAVGSSYNMPRVQDHPVDGFAVGSNGDVHVFVHEHVPGITHPSNKASLVRYTLEVEGLRNYTREAMSELESCADVANVPSRRCQHCRSG